MISFCNDCVDGNEDDGEGDRKDAAKASRRAAMLRDVNPSSTLEPSFDSLNVKKFDIAFAVDPLFHKTSAQFDEGGARGTNHSYSMVLALQYLLLSIHLCQKALDGQKIN